MTSLGWQITNIATDEILSFIANNFFTFKRFCVLESQICLWKLKTFKIMDPWPFLIQRLQLYDFNLEIICLFMHLFKIFERFPAIESPLLFLMVQTRQILPWLLFKIDWKSGIWPSKCFFWAQFNVIDTFSPLLCKKSRPMFGSFSRRLYNHLSSSWRLKMIVFYWFLSHLLLNFWLEALQ